MLNLKGLYEWKLIDKDTQETVQQGEQWNVISDVFHAWMFRSSPIVDDACYGGFYEPMAILISNSTPNPLVDYRIAGKSHWFNVLAQGDWKNTDGGVDWTLKSKYTDMYFTPPVSPRTITVIGVKLGYRGGSTYVDYVAYNSFPSFIELSTPITQDSTQYLYVKYTLFCSYDSSKGNYGVISNSYTDRFMAQSIFTQNLLYMGSRRTPGVAITPFLPPVDVDNVMRSVRPIFSFSTGHNVQYVNNRGSRLSYAYVANFATTTIPGPLGVVVFQQYSSNTVSTWDYYMNNIYGYTNTQVGVPSIARIFAHPGNRDSVIFRDPDPYPALSQGTISVTGTPTNKFSMIARIRVTKTGDASDLVDETVPYTSVNTGNSQITITQDFTTGDIYRISSSGTLPSPLVASTDYYIIRIDSTHIQLAATSGDAIAGNEIVLTTQGTGNHTLVRQNTGKYRLELEPYFPTTNSYAGVLILNQLSMAIDFDGNVMPAILSSGSTPNALADADYPAGGTYFAVTNDAYPGPNVMIRGTAQNGDYIYSVQQSRKGLINNICRWRFNTIETSVPLCKFGNGSTVVEVTLGTADYMYIATNDGMYRYAFATPTVAPVLVTITGLIASNIQDACLDPITGYMWTGHSTGLSRIDISDPDNLTATQYLRGVGEALEGLSAANVNIFPGQLDAYNGRILKGGGCMKQTSWGGVAVDNSCWVMLDNDIKANVWYTYLGSFNGACLRKGTDQIVLKTPSTQLYLYNVTVTGKNAGTTTSVESWGGLPYSSGNVTYNIIQLSDNQFTYFYQSGYNYGTEHAFCRYTIGSSPVETQMQGYSFDDANYSYALARWGWAAGARRNKVDLDGNGTYAFIYQNWLIANTFPNPMPFGWDGSAWIRGNTTSRNIPKTDTHPLVNGLSINFNNATGALWDKQYILNECYNVCHGPQVIKDNLQTYSVRCKNYQCAAYVVEDYSASVGASGPYVIYIPEKSDPNFRDMDTQDYVTEVLQGATVFTQYTPAQRTVTFTSSSTVNSGTGSIPTGTPVYFYNATSTYGDGYPQGPLESGKTYYAINASATTIRLAPTYADALAGTNVIVWVGGQQGTQYMGVVTPSAGTYCPTLSGDFFFNSADAGKAMTLTYTYTKFST